MEKVNSPRPNSSQDYKKSDMDWKQTGLLPEDAVEQYGPECVRVGHIKNGYNEDIVEIFTERIPKGHSSLTAWQTIKEKDVRILLACTDLPDDCPGSVNDVPFELFAYLHKHELGFERCPHCGSSMEYKEIMIKKKSG